LLNKKHLTKVRKDFERKIIVRGWGFSNRENVLAIRPAGISRALAME
jgi:hypothetical protein